MGLFTGDINHFTTRPQASAPEACGKRTHKIWGSQAVGRGKPQKGYLGKRLAPSLLALIN